MIRIKSDGTPDGRYKEDARKKPVKCNKVLILPIAKSAADLLRYERLKKLGWAIRHAGACHDR